MADGGEDGLLELEGFNDGRLESLSLVPFGFVSSSVQHSCSPLSLQESSGTMSPPTKHLQQSLQLHERFPMVILSSS